MISYLISYFSDNIRVAQERLSYDIIHDIIVYDIIYDIIVYDIINDIIYDISMKNYDIMYDII
jgi:hypothetical protein